MIFNKQLFFQKVPAKDLIQLDERRKSIKESFSIEELLSKYGNKNFLYDKTPSSSSDNVTSSIANRLILSGMVRKNRPKKFEKLVLSHFSTNNMMNIEDKNSKNKPKAPNNKEDNDHDMPQ